MAKKKFSIKICYFFVLILWPTSIAAASNDRSSIDISLPRANYSQKVSDLGFIHSGFDGQWYMFWSNGKLRRHPAIGQSIDLAGHRIEYLRWKADGNKFVIGSASGDSGRGWAWIVDAKSFTISRKLAGNIITAWFTGSDVAYIKSNGRRQLYVLKNKRKWLASSTTITASSDDGKFWLARTGLRHDQGYKGSVIILKNCSGIAHRIAVVQTNIELPDEPSEHITSNRASNFMITLCSNQAHIATLCNAYYVDRANGTSTPIMIGLKSRISFFNIDAYESPIGFVGICRTVDDQYGDRPIYTEYRYTLRNGKLVIKNRITGSVIAYSADAEGHEAYLLERNGTVHLHLDKIEAR